MNTIYINEDKKERFLTEFEKKCLKEEWVDGYADEYPLDLQEVKFNKWVEDMSWMDIDLIMEKYI